MKTILCTTPINHLSNLKKELKKYGRLIYKPNISKKQIKKILKLNKKIDFIFCNPNRQGYILDREVLNNSSGTPNILCLIELLYAITPPWKIFEDPGIFVS